MRFQKLCNVIAPETTNQSGWNIHQNLGRSEIASPSIASASFDTAFLIRGMLVSVVTAPASDLKFMKNRRGGSVPQLAAGSPFPFLEQVGDHVLEARQQVFAIKRAAGSEQAPLRGGVADFDHFPIRIDDPGEACAAGEVVT